MSNSPRHRDSERSGEAEHASPPEKSHPLYCSFCGKGEFEVAVLVSGPTVFICNECVEICVAVCLDGMGKRIMETRLATEPLKA